MNQAARLLQSQQGGLHQINKETTEKLKEKHPAGTKATQEALLSGEIEAPHTVTFSSINQEMVRKAAMEISGPPGPSGMDANTWRMLLTSKRNNMAASDLFKAVAELTQKMGYKNCQHLEALINCKLIPPSKTKKMMSNQLVLVRCSEE